MKLHKYVPLIIVAILLTVGGSNAQVQQKISEPDLKDLLGRIDADTDRFAKSADKALDKSGFNKSAREDELNAHLKRLKTATEALKNDHTAANAKSNFETVLHHGVAIENFLRRNPLDGVEDEWTTLRSDLGDLASGFNITWEQGHALGAPVGEADIKNLLQHLEDMADKYKLTLDAALDNSPLNNTNAEDEINTVNADFRKRPVISRMFAMTKALRRPPKKFWSKRNGSMPSCKNTVRNSRPRYRVPGERCEPTWKGLRASTT